VQDSGSIDYDSFELIIITFATFASTHQIVQSFSIIHDHFVALVVKRSRLLAVCGLRTIIFC